MKKIIFLPFINGNKADEGGRQWRKALEDTFLGGEGKDITDEINRIRGLKSAASGDDVAMYRNQLHGLKMNRQSKWLKRLVEKTAEEFSSTISALPENVRNSDDHIIVAALPEFFWYDINDNHRHEPGDSAKNGIYIKGYHKPLYDVNLIDVLLHGNPLAKLTEDYNNLIIFAGTAMWKIINEENNKDEKINNTLIIYHGGEVANTWSKHYFSSIDGFCTPVWFGSGPNDYYYELVKDKLGTYGTQFESAPITEFKGVKFTYDICLDFAVKKNDVIQSPLSTTLCGGEKTDVNVLVSAGMPIDDKDLTKINSPVILRCDGWAVAPFAEIASNVAYPPNNPNSVMTNADIIGRLETTINV